MIFNKPFDDDIFNKMKATGYWNVKKSIIDLHKNIKG